MVSDTNKIMHEHFAWFNTLYPPKEPTVQTEPNYTYEQKLVLEYRKQAPWLSLKDIALQTALYDRGLISYFEYETHVINRSLTYPFKTN